jgi:hypothetical protein
MADISTIRTDLISIVGNNRLPIKSKMSLIRRKLKAINIFIDLKPNKIFNQKKSKINKILSILPSIKYNVDLKKLLTQKLITDLTNFESYPYINSSIETKEDDIKGYRNLNQENVMEIFRNTNPQNKIIIKESKKQMDSEEKSEVTEIDSEVENKYSEETDDDSEETDDDSEETDDDSDATDEESEATDEESKDELDKTVNNLIDDLTNDEKVKLIIKLTKYKLEHEFKMEAENNRNIERMEELAIKKLKIKNKYKLKKLENRK